MTTWCCCDGADYICLECLTRADPELEDYLRREDEELLKFRLEGEEE